MRASPIGQEASSASKRKALLSSFPFLLHCPLTQPAAQWLCDLWAAIDDGNTPPATPHAIIAGDPTAWRPAHLETELWTRLRVTYL